MHVIIKYDSFPYDFYNINSQLRNCNVDRIESPSFSFKKCSYITIATENNAFFLHVAEEILELIYSVAMGRPKFCIQI